MHLIYYKYRQVIVKGILTILILLLIYVIFTYLLPFFAPFVVAVIIALINEPVIIFLEKKIRLPRKYAAIISLLLTIGTLGALVILGIIKIYNELVVLQGNITTYINGVSNQINEYFARFAAYYNALPDGITSAVNENLKGLAPKLQGLITSLVSYLISTLTSIPKMGVFIIVTLLSSYFISSDRRQIREFIYRQLPENWSKNLAGIKSGTFAALIGYLKAQLILISFTFAEVSTGLLILHADYTLLMGLLVAISDAVPVVGTSIIMVPWILWNVITGDMHMAFGLAVIYVLGVLIRQILEPKLVGNQIGLHPLITLIAMYVGLEIFGLMGMVIGPVSIIIVKNLQSSGAIRIWKE